MIISCCLGDSGCISGVPCMYLTALLFVRCQAVAGRPILSAANTRVVNAAAIVTNAVQASAGNIVQIRHSQKPVVVGPTGANVAQQPSVPVVGGRIIAASTPAANMSHRPVVPPANAPVATGMMLNAEICPEMSCNWN